MTWVPKNRPENDDDENSDKDADEKGNFSSKSTHFTSKITPIVPRNYLEFSQKY